MLSFCVSPIWENWSRWTSRWIHQFDKCMSKCCNMVPKVVIKCRPGFVKQAQNFSGKSNTLQSHYFNFQHKILSFSLIFEYVWRSLHFDKFQSVHLNVSSDKINNISKNAVLMNRAVSPAKILSPHLPFINEAALINWSAKTNILLPTHAWVKLPFSITAHYNTSINQRWTIIFRWKRHWAV
jgi:hypothetical protein